MAMATLRRREMGQLPAAGTLRLPEMVQLPAAGTLGRREMAQLQVQVTLPGREMAQLQAAGTLGRVVAVVLATVRRLVSVEVRATVGRRALVRAVTVGPLAAVCLTGPAASQTAASLLQALGRAAGLLVWLVSGLPLAAAGLLGWAWMG
jgi:hypothetical protein